MAVVLLRKMNIDHQVVKLNLSHESYSLILNHTPNIRFTANAQFPGSITVKTGVLLGIWSVEWIFTNMSALSENGGQPKVGNSELAATKP